MPETAEIEFEDEQPQRPPGAIPTQDTRPLSSIQVARRESLRLAISHHRSTVKPFTDSDVLATAGRFADYIRNGQTEKSDG